MTGREIFFWLKPDDGTAGETLTVPSFMRRMTGQALLVLANQCTFKITVKFDHHCPNAMPVCYPSVSAHTDTVTFPVVFWISVVRFLIVQVFCLRDL